MRKRKGYVEYEKFAESIEQSGFDKLIIESILENISIDNLKDLAAQMESDSQRISGESWAAFKITLNDYVNNNQYRDQVDFSGRNNLFIATPTQNGFRSSITVNDKVGNVSDMAAFRRRQIDCIAYLLYDSGRAVNGVQIKDVDSKILDYIYTCYYRLAKEKLTTNNPDDPSLISIGIDSICSAMGFSSMAAGITTIVTKLKLILDANLTGFVFKQGELPNAYPLMSKMIIDEDNQIVKFQSPYFDALTAAAPVRKHAYLIRPTTFRQTRVDDVYETVKILIQILKPMQRRRRAKIGIDALIKRNCKLRLRIEESSRPKAVIKNHLKKAAELIAEDTIMLDVFQGLQFNGGDLTNISGSTTEQIVMSFDKLVFESTVVKNKKFTPLENRFDNWPETQPEKEGEADDESESEEFEYSF